jgi:hypothetical protein
MLAASTWGAAGCSRTSSSSKTFVASIFNSRCATQSTGALEAIINVLQKSNNFTGGHVLGVAHDSLRNASAAVASV